MLYSRVYLENQLYFAQLIIQIFTFHSKQCVLLIKSYYTFLHGCSYGVRFVRRMFTESFDFMMFFFTID